MSSKRAKLQELSTFKYLLAQQKKCEKVSRIKYDNLELQDYLQLSSNLKLEDQRFSVQFSLRCEMNLLKTNFKRNESIGSKICIKLKVEALKQAKSNDEQIKKEGSTL